MREQTQVQKVIRYESFPERHMRDQKRQLRREFKTHVGNRDERRQLSRQPFNWKNMDLWTRHLCMTPTTLEPGMPGDKSRPSMIYGYFHRNNKIEGLCIVPATSSIKQVHASMALYPAENMGRSDDKIISAYVLGSVYTITNSPQFFRVPSMPTHRGSSFLTKDEALAFFARRIHALLFNDLQNVGNFSRHIFKSTVYEGPVFRFEPGEIPDNILLPDVDGRWQTQNARYPLGITQDEIDDLTKIVRETDYRPPLPLDSYMAAAQEGLDAFSPTPELGAATLRRISHLTSLQESVAYSEAVYPEP